MDRTKQELQSVVTRYRILHNYLLQKNLHSNTRKLNTKAIIIALILLHTFEGIQHLKPYFSLLVITKMKVVFTTLFNI